MLPPGLLKPVPHKLPTSPETQITLHSSVHCRSQDARTTRHLSLRPSCSGNRSVIPRPLQKQTLRYKTSCLPPSYSTADCTWPVWESLRSSLPEWKSDRRGWCRSGSPLQHQLTWTACVFGRERDEDLVRIRMGRISGEAVAHTRQAASQWAPSPGSHTF